MPVPAPGGLLTGYIKRMDAFAERFTHLALINAVIHVIRAQRQPTIPEPPAA